LPVMMVHAPVPAVLDEGDGLRPVTPDEIAYYLGETVRYSQTADIIGFDVYPIPPEFAQVTSPYLDGEQADVYTTLTDYAAWLAEIGEGRPYFLALQAFAYADLGDLGPDAPAAAAQKPTPDDLRTMACAAWEGGAAVIVWWGQSLLDADDAAFWADVLAASRAITRDPVNYCTAL
ncbi:MAG: hypothetical protein GYB65_05395, partial [Chloroflexi bacterium]|nr:hypothetical protein [Chloroflexota bacterium]